METAGLYWTAQRLGKRALSLLTISDHIFTGESLSAQERQDFLPRDDGDRPGDCLEVPGGLTYGAVRKA